ncbi:MAG: DUF1593 domain-containing protein, partial [Bacteroidetes bacterium]|nr:DUF1593 domain-containing protein [Bacteroidota bacterium]
MFFLKINQIDLPGFKNLEGLKINSIHQRWATIGNLFPNLFPPLPRHFSAGQKKKKAFLSIQILLILSLLPQLTHAQFFNEKPRVFVLTDIENEPDDAQSLVRFLTYCNQWDVEGIVATTSCWQRSKTAEWRIHEIVDAYGKVRKNLE